ncbi:MAG: D-alanyl-D-alanine carboxypeptidase family protein [Bacilli bacterium]
MKKIICFLFVFFLLITNVYANNEEKLIENANSGILIEASSGEILFEKKKDEKVAVASMTKMVAQIIILENIENGNLSWDEKIKVSSNAAGMGGSQIWLQPGEEMSVRDLMKGITMASANDATVALAERIAGTEEAFVKLMNDKVKELGLKNTHFVNPTGLDEENHYSSAYDMAMIARELLNHEQILEFSSVYEDYIRVDTPNKFWLVNTNKLVRFYEGADGLKTGFTDNAKYCMAVTAKRDNMRLIAVVLGEASGKVRNSETMELLDYGFNLYKVDLVKSKTDKVGTLKLDKSIKENVDIFPQRDITILGKKSDVSLNYDIEIKINNNTLPLKKGDVVGKIIIKNGNKTVREENAIINENIEKMGFFQTLGKTLKDIVTGEIF